MITAVLFYTLVSLAGPAIPARPVVAASVPTRHLYVPTGIAIPVANMPGTHRLSGLFQQTPLAALRANAKAAPPISLMILVRKSGHPAIWTSACSL